MARRPDLTQYNVIFSCFIDNHRFTPLAMWSTCRSCSMHWYSVKHVLIWRFSNFALSRGVVANWIECLWTMRKDLRKRLKYIWRAGKPQQPWAYLYARGFKVTTLHCIVFSFFSVRMYHDVKSRSARIDIDGLHQISELSFEKTIKEDLLFTRISVDLHRNITLKEYTTATPTKKLSKKSRKKSFRVKKRVKRRIKTKVGHH